MSYYDAVHAQISELENIRKEIISALNEVGVTTPANTTYDELPNYVMKIGGVDTTGWPIDMSSIGYTAEDSRRACYRYICKMIDESPDKGFLNFENLKRDIQKEIELSKEKIYDWNALLDKTNASNFFDYWPGKFPPMLDTSNVTVFDGFFMHTSCVHYPLYDTSNATSTAAMFHNSNTPHEIPEFDFRNSDNFEFGYGGSFWNTYIFSPKNIGVTPPISYYTMLGMLAAGSNGWWWNPFYHIDITPGRCFITNKIIFRPYKVTDPQRRNMFELTPGITACEGFEGLDVPEFDFTNSDGQSNISGDPATIYISRNSFMNIINGMVDATAAFYPGFINEGVMKIYTRQDFASYKIRTKEERWQESYYDSHNLRWYGHGYYTAAELSQWESIHGSVSNNERNLREFLLTVGHFPMSPGEQYYDSRFPNWKISDNEVELQFSSTAEGTFFVVPIFYIANSMDEMDYDRYINGTDNIIFRKPFSFTRVLHDSNMEGSVIPEGVTPGDGGKRIVRVTKDYWDNVLTQADKDLILYKGYDVYHPA